MTNEKKKILSIFLLNISIECHRKKLNKISPIEQQDIVWHHFNMINYNYVDLSMPIIYIYIYKW